MPTSSAVTTGNRDVLMQLGLLLLAAFSAVMLFSFGGQLVLAPVLLPMQWVIARNSTGLTSMTFSVLGAFLAAELVGLTLGLLAAGLNLSPLLAIVVVPAGLLSGILFYKRSRPTES